MVPSMDGSGRGPQRPREHRLVPLPDTTVTGSDRYGTVCSSSEHGVAEWFGPDADTRAEALRLGQIAHDEEMALHN